ncbi:MAG: hypothetical protein AAFP84_21055, partial [Actinomycetota bacterium]
GRHFDIADPTELAAVYAQLRARITAVTTVSAADLDDDTLADCEEMNGLFTPISFNLGGWLGNLDYPRGWLTNPSSDDTDGDGLRDSDELERRSLTADPILADEYSALIDAGITDYFKLISNPTSADGDNDGLTDPEELDLGTSPIRADTDRDGIDDLLEIVNGTDPLIPNGSPYVEGLDLARFTLLQPDGSITDDNAFSRSQLVVNDGLREEFFQPTIVTYDPETNQCVTNCDAIVELAEAWGTDNEGFVPCIGPFKNCTTIEQQISTIVTAYVLAQGIFDDNGNIRPEFAADQAFKLCVIEHAAPNECDPATITAAVPTEIAPAAFGAVMSDASRASLPDNTTRPSQNSIRRVGARLAAGLLVAAVVSNEVADQLARDCLDSKAIQELDRIGILTPCEAGPIYANGADTPNLTQFRAASLRFSNFRRVTQWSSTGETLGRGIVRRWFRGIPPCDTQGLADFETRFTGAAECDEFPHYTTISAGPAFAAIFFVPRLENRADGGFWRGFNSFTRTCVNVTSGPVGDREPIIYLPSVDLPRTVWTCGVNGPSTDG